MTVTEKGGVSHGSIYVPKPEAALAAWCKSKHIKHLRHKRKTYLIWSLIYDRDVC